MMQFCKAFKLVFAFTLLQLSFVLAQDEESGGSSFQQVPVCAPLSPSGSQVSSTIRGEKGDQGFPGKFGPKGDKGGVGEKGEPGPPGYDLPNNTQCPGITFHLPRHNQKTDYVRYRGYVPSMAETTVCAWVEAAATRDLEEYSALLSYAVRSDDNELLLMFHNPRSLYFETQNIYETLDIPTLMAKQKHHICVQFSSRTHQARLYINATEILTRSFQGGVLEGGGDLLLGQDQDAYNATRLDANQSFSGKITNFMIWPRLISDQEISSIARHCKCPPDFSVSMTMDKAELHGRAKYLYSQRCPILA